MKIIPSALLFSSLFLISCRQIPAQETRWIDDIVPDSMLDNPDFKICNTNEQIIQYFNDGNGIQYQGGKPIIDSLFFNIFHSVKVNQSGFIRIRFVVNCFGETGRFRLLGSDLNYQPYQFTPEITEQLTQITKSMDGWQPKTWKGMKVDYYQYLIFKIENGKLTHILP